MATRGWSTPQKLIFLRGQPAPPGASGFRGYTIVLGIIASTALAHGAARAQSDSPSSANLASLRGTMIWSLEKDVTLSGTFWAKRNCSRTEMQVGDARIISIQISDTLYTYRQSTTRGEKLFLGQGLGSMEIVRQIEVMRTRGKRTGTQEWEGVEYEMYEYEDTAGEMAVALLSPTTSLPGIWTSRIKNSDGDVSVETMIYRDLVVNVAIPAEMFAPPPGIEFMAAAGDIRD